MRGIDKLMKDTTFGCSLLIIIILVEHLLYSDGSIKRMKQYLDTQVQKTIIIYGEGSEDCDKR